jgi:hypothetical protein
MFDELDNYVMPLPTALLLIGLNVVVCITTATGWTVRS